MTEATTEPRWFQFTTRRLFGVTIWATIALVAWRLIRSEYAEFPLDAIACLALFGCPFVSLGTLAGHSFVGALIGLLAAMVGFGTFYGMP